MFGKMMDDGSVAIAMAALLFFIPARKADGKQTRLLTEEVFSKLPWSVVLLFGGGFALAYGFAESGLSVYIASQLQGLKSAGLPSAGGAMTSSWMASARAVSLRARATSARPKNPRRRAVG